MKHIVEYVGERMGEEPFLLGGKKYQFVTALYPNGKKDIGVYIFGNDMVVDYEWWMDQNFISYKDGGSIEDLEKKNPTLKASRDFEKRDKDFEIFETSNEAEAMMAAEAEAETGAEVDADGLDGIDIPMASEIGADGAEAAFEKGGAIEYDWKKAPKTYTKLPYKLTKYFEKPKGSVRVSVSKLNPTSMVQSEVERAYEKMKQAFLGEIPKRQPLSLRKKRSATGKITYDVLDGNSTFANAYLSGWTSVIGNVIEEVSEGKNPSIAEIARATRKKGETWADAFARATKTYNAQKLAKGGDIEVKIVNEGVKFDKKKYPAFFNDTDSDKISDVDDPRPLKTGDKKPIEQVSLTDVMERLINVKEGLDDRMENVVESMKSKSPAGSKIYARTKTPYSIINKLVNKRLGTLTDMIGTTIEVENQDGLEMLRKRVEQGEFGQVLDFDNYYENPKGGYRAYHFIVDAEGVPTEIQLKTRRQKTLNQSSHEPYKKEKLNTTRLNELSLMAQRADEGDKAAMEEFDLLMKYPKAVEKQLTLP